MLVPVHSATVPPIQNSALTGWPMRCLASGRAGGPCRWGCLPVYTAGQTVWSRGGGKDMVGLFRRVRHACATSTWHAWPTVWRTWCPDAGRHGVSAGETADDLAVQRTGEAVLAEAAELAAIEQQVMAEYQNAAGKAKPVPQPRRPPPVDCI